MDNIRRGAEMQQTLFGGAVDDGQVVIASQTGNGSGDDDQLMDTLEALPKPGGAGDMPKKAHIYKRMPKKSYRMESPFGLETIYEEPFMEQLAYQEYMNDIKNKESGKLDENDVEMIQLQIEEECKKFLVEYYEGGH